MRAKTCFVLLLAVIVLTPAASAAVRRRPVERSDVGAIRISFDFTRGAAGWEGDFADYSSTADYGGLELEAGLRELPAEAGPGSAFFIAGMNRPDDLFMFLRRRIGPEEGIEPDRDYLVAFTVSFASNAPSDCPGIGGSPGNSVWLKTGASAKKPEPVLDRDGYWVMNIDKGQQAGGGVDASVAGDIANGIFDCLSTKYVSIFRIHRHPYVVRSSAAGELWLVVGTDSGFEGKTALFYQSILVSLTPLAGVSAASERDTPSAAADAAR